ncbi:MAG: hypothetical protein AB1Z57_06375 [Acidimicrobiia bacterium]
MPVWLIVLEVALGLVVAAFLIHQVASWADMKGWIRYRPRSDDGAE